MSTTKTLQKKQPTGMNYTALESLVRACSESNVVSFRKGDIEIIFGVTDPNKQTVIEKPVYVVASDAPRPTIDHEIDLLHTKSSDAVIDGIADKDDTMYNTLESLMISDPEAYEELVQEGLSEERRHGHRLQ